MTSKQTLNKLQTNLMETEAKIEEIKKSQQHIFEKEYPLLYSFSFTKTSQDKDYGDMKKWSGLFTTYQEAHRVSKLIAAKIPIIVNESNELSDKELNNINKVIYNYQGWCDESTFSSESILETDEEITITSINIE